MVLTTVNANQSILHVLSMPRSFVLMIPWLVILLVSWCLSLDLEDLVVQVLEFVGPSHSLFKSDRWYNTRGIPLNDRIESFEEPRYLLLHSVD